MGDIAIVQRQWRAEAATVFMAIAITLLFHMGIRMKAYKNGTGVLVAAAIAGIFSGSAHAATSAGTGIVSAPSVTTMAGVAAQSPLAADADAGKHDCRGKNECKGQGGCESGDNGCSGKNSCKGKGGCNSEHR